MKTDEELIREIAEQLAIQTLEDESLAGIYVWQWVIDNGFVQEYLDKATQIHTLYRGRIEAATKQAVEDAHIEKQMEEEEVLGRLTNAKKEERERIIGIIESDPAEVYIKRARLLYKL